MALREADLLSGERVMLSKRAKLITGIDTTGYGGPDSEPPAGETGTVALDGGQAVAGRLYLTNLRLVFRARGGHPDGRVGVQLPTVKDIRYAPAGRRSQLDVVTGPRRFTFLVRGGVLRLVAAIVLRVDVHAEPVPPEV